MNQRTTEIPEARVGPISPAQSNIASLAFWGMLLFLAIATVGLALIGNMRTGDTGQTNKVEIDLTHLERALGASSREALRVVVPDIDPLLSDAYRPVYAAIPEYVDFHYSVLGEYTELAAAAQGRIGTHLQERLFDGFDQRFNEQMDILDAKYFELYKSTLDAEIQAAISEQTPHGVLSEATQLVLNDAVARAQISFPLAGAAVILGSSGVKALTAGLAAKLTAKVTAKAAAKGALKGGSLLAGAGGGAALCAWGGPLALACGAIGGIGAWVLADAAIVNLDQFFNRDEFEATLRDLVDQHKADIKQRVIQALAFKGQELDKVITEDFSLSEIHEPDLEN